MKFYRTYVSLGIWYTRVKLNRLIARGYALTDGKVLETSKRLDYFLGLWDKK